LIIDHFAYVIWATWHWSSTRTCKHRFVMRPDRGKPRPVS